MEDRRFDMATNVFRTIAMILLTLLFGQMASASGAPAVFVSIVPQKFFVQQIGKDLVDVRVMVEPGASPAIYEPKPRQMVELSKSAAYFAVGVPFERAWLGKISATNPDMKVFHTEQGIDKAPMAAHRHRDHEEEALGGHHDRDANGHEAHEHEPQHAEGPGRHDHGHARDRGILDPTYGFLLRWSGSRLSTLKPAFSKSIRNTGANMRQTARNSCEKSMHWTPV
jgi:zinc transport system substrate-binding protein